MASGNCNLHDLDCNEFAAFLEKKKISSDVIAKFKEEAIDGETYLALSDEELDQFTTKLGIKKKLISIQKEAKTDVKANDDKSTSYSYTMVVYKKKNYCLSNVPLRSDILVMDSVQEIEGELHLQDLGDDLSRLGRFVRIAYFGVVGHVSLQIKVRDNLRSVFELCHDTSHALNDFKRSSQEALDILQTAYRYLEEAMEDEALQILTTLQDISKEMQNKAGTLSQRCKEQSKSLKAIGDNTMNKQDEVKKERERKTDELKGEEKATTEEINVAESDIQTAQSDLKSTYESEKQAIASLKKKQEENHERAIQLTEKTSKKREILDTKYKELLSKAKKDHEISITKINKDYNDSLKTNKIYFEEKRLKETGKYEKALQENKKELDTQLKENNTWLDNEIVSNQKACSEAIHSRSKAIDMKITEIENECNLKKGIIDTELAEKLKLNENIRNTSISKNKVAMKSRKSENSKECLESKSKKWVWQSGSKYDDKNALEDKEADAQQAAADTEAEKAKNQQDYDDTKDANDKKAELENKKQDEIKPLRQQKLGMVDEEEEKKREEDTLATAKKKEKDEEAKLNKASLDSEAKTTKNLNISKAELDWENADTEALQSKKKLMSKAALTRDKEIKTIEKQHVESINQHNEEIKFLKEQLQSTLDAYTKELESIEKRQFSNQKIIEEKKKERTKKKRQMQKVVEQLMSCKNQADIHKIAGESLQEAVGALNEIEMIVTSVGHFWKEVGSLCEKVTGRSLKKNIDILSKMDASKRKAVWQSDAFKVDALNFYGKWIALNEVCTSASTKVNGALQEVKRYMVENPNEEMAFKSLQEMGLFFLKELKN